MYIHVALSPGSSQFFNAMRRKTGEPGRRSHVSAIAQPLCTVEYRTVPELYWPTLLCDGRC